jgi:hypothetical protein
MSTDNQLMDRPSPTLAEWLDDVSDIGRAEDYQQWLRTSIELERGVLTDEEARSVRLVHILSIACVEACRIETEQHGADFSEVTIALARAAGVACFGAVVSGLRNDAPLIKIANVVSGEFEHGAKVFARATLKQRQTAETVQ